MRYKEYASKVVKEIEQVLSDVDEEEVLSFVDAIAEAQKIQVFGMGRMGFSGRAFAMRLKHLGLESYMVWETVTPAIGEGDLLIVNCGCTRFGEEVAKLAKKAGAKVALITAHPESDIGKISDVIVRLPAQVLRGGEGEIPSIQPMASLFEQTLLVLCDIVALLLIDKLRITEEYMEKMHTNLDSYMG